MAPKGDNFGVIDQNGIHAIEGILAGVAPAVGLGHNPGARHHPFNLDNTNINLYGNYFSNNGILQPRDSFLNAIQHWEFNVPMQSLWAIIFEFPPVLRTLAQAVAVPGAAQSARNQSYTINSPDKPQTDTLLEVLGEFSPSDHTNMNASGVIKLLQQDAFQKAVGCLFAQSVQIPGESIAYDWQMPHNSSSGGLIGFPVFNNRQGFVPLNIGFRETNLSFIEFVIRPWLILASHLGLVERREAEGLGIKSNMHIIQFAKAGSALQDPNVPGKTIENKIPLIPRKIWHFYNCVPTRVPPGDYNYSEGTIETRNIEFIYTRYTVQAPQKYINVAKQLADKSDKVLKENRTISQPRENHARSMEERSKKVNWSSRTSYTHHQMNKLERPLNTKLDSQNNVVYGSTDSQAARQEAYRSNGGLDPDQVGLPAKQENPANVGLTQTMKSEFHARKEEHEHSKPGWLNPSKGKYTDTFDGQETLLATNSEDHDQPYAKTKKGFYGRNEAIQTNSDRILPIKWIQPEKLAGEPHAKAVEQKDNPNAIPGKKPAARSEDDIDHLPEAPPKSTNPNVITQREYWVNGAKVSKATYDAHSKAMDEADAARRKKFDNFFADPLDKKGHKGAVTDAITSEDAKDSAEEKAVEPAKQKARAAKEDEIALPGRDHRNDSQVRALMKRPEDVSHQWKFTPGNHWVDPAKKTEIRDYKHHAEHEYQQHDLGKAEGRHKPISGEVVRDANDTPVMDNIQGGPTSWGDKSGLPPGQKDLEERHRNTEEIGDRRNDGIFPSSDKGGYKGREAQTFYLKKHAEGKAKSTKPQHFRNTTMEAHEGSDASQYERDIKAAEPSHSGVARPTLKNADMDVMDKIQGARGPSGLDPSQPYDVEGRHQMHNKGNVPSGTKGTAYEKNEIGSDQPSFDQKDIQVMDKVQGARGPSGLSPARPYDVEGRHEMHGKGNVPSGTKGTAYEKNEIGSDQPSFDQKSIPVMDKIQGARGPSGQSPEMPYDIEGRHETHKKGLPESSTQKDTSSGLKSHAIEQDSMQYGNRSTPQVDNSEKLKSHAIEQDSMQYGNRETPQVDNTADLVNHSVTQEGIQYGDRSTPQVDNSADLVSHSVTQEGIQYGDRSTPQVDNTADLISHSITQHGKQYGFRVPPKPYW